MKLKTKLIHDKMSSGKLSVILLFASYLISLVTCQNTNFNLRAIYRKNSSTRFESTNENQLWITMDSDVSSDVSQSGISSRMISTGDNGTSLLHVDEKSLPLFSRILSTKKRRFGEYVVHRSLEDANRFISRAKFGDQSVFITPQIDNGNVVKALQMLIDSNRVNLFDQMIANSFKNRDYNSPFGYEASQWVKNKWTQIALPRNDIIVKNYEHQGFKQNSVIVTILGSEELDDVEQDSVVIIGAHLDSINNYDFDQENMRAPGADDDASGLSVITEALQVIVDSGYRPQKTIQIMGFAGEEKGLRGSGDIASYYRRIGIKVMGMLNFDMVGYKGRGKDIYISIDTTNKDLSAFLATLISTYLPNVSYDYMGPKGSCNGCSDHAKWSANDFPAVMATAAKGPRDPNTFNPTYHTTNDLKVDEATMKNFAFLTVAYAAELAKGDIK